MVTLSVVILNYNVKHYIYQCIISVQRALEGIDSEIIVVDNHSTDGSVPFLQQHFPEIVYIENSANLGFSKANNIAVRAAKGTYVCILNPDTLLPENVFKNTLKVAQSTLNVGGIGAAMFDGTGRFLPESKRQVPTPWRAFSKLLGLKNTQGYYFNKLQAEQAGPVPILTGAFFLVKRELYLKVGGFSEAYFMYGEDIDLSYTLEKTGYKNYYLGSTAILHFKGESTVRDKVYYERFYGAITTFYERHFSTHWWKLHLAKHTIGFAKFLKQKTASDKSKSATTQHDNYILLSKNSNIKKALEKHYNTTITQVEGLEQLPIGLQNSLLIFDCTSISFFEIIQFMKQHPAEYRYRILPPKENFLGVGEQSKTLGVKETVISLG